jgi:long-chain acyl-CoA synthetase
VLQDAGHEGDVKALCASEKVREFLLAEMNKTGKENKLKGFEFARAIHLEAEPFSPENDLLTPTFKPKRPQLKNHYEPQIASLYKELDSKPKKAE